VFVKRTLLDGSVVPFFFVQVADGLGSSCLMFAAVPVHRSDRLEPLPFFPVAAVTNIIITTAISTSTGSMVNNTSPFHSPPF